MNDRCHSEVTGIPGLILRIVGKVLSLPFKIQKKKHGR